MALPLVLATVAARADEWQVKRGPLAQRLVLGSLAVLRRDPHDAAALSHLVAAARNGRGVAALEAQLAAGAALDAVASRDRFRASPGGDSRGGSKGPSRGPFSSGSEAIVLGHLRALRGDDAGAEEAYRAALKQRPGDARAEVALAVSVLRLGRRDEARALLEGALPRLACRGPSSPCADALRRLESLALDDGALDSAQRYATRLAAIDPTHVEPLERLAERMEQAGRVESALVLWRSIERARGDWRLRALRRIAALSAALGDFGAARASLARAQAISRDGEAVFEELVAVCRQQGSLAELLAREERTPARVRSAAGWLRVARLLEELGRMGEAVAALRRARADAPRSTEVRRRLLGVLDRGGRYEEAASEYRRFVAEAPGDLALRVDAARYLHARGGALREEAYAMLRDGSERARSDVGAHRVLLEACDRVGDADGALREQEVLARLDPTNERDQVALGERRWLRGERPRAIATWLALLGRDQSPRAMARVADVLADHDQWPDAIALLRRALAATPTDQTLRRALALLLDRAGHDRQAEGEWSTLISADDRALRTEARSRLVRLWAREGRLADELPELSQRFSGPPPDAAAGLLEVAVLREQGRGDEALEVLGRVIAVAAGEDRGEALVARSELLRAGGRLAESLASLAEAASLLPGRARSLWGDAAQIAVALHRDADALAYARRATAPGDAPSELRLASVAERTGELGEAESALRRAIGDDRSSWGARLALARLRLLRGDAAEAQRILVELAAAGDDTTAREAASRAIDLAEARGTLAELEAPFLAAGERTRRALVTLCERRADDLRARAQRGDLAARVELERMIARLRQPLVDALAGGDAATVRGAARLFADAAEIDRPTARALIALAIDRPGRGGAAAEPPVVARVLAAAIVARAPEHVAPSSWRALATSGERDLRLIAVDAAGRLDGADAASVVTAALGDPHPGVRAMACAAVATRPASAPLPACATPTLAQLLDPEQPSLVRAACALAVAACSGDATAAAVAPLLDAREALVRRAAARALARAIPPRPAQLLDVALADEDPQVRRAAAEALGDASWRASEPAQRGTAGPPDASRVVERLSEGRDRAAPWVGDPAEAGSATGRILAGPRQPALRLLGDLAAGPAGISLGPLTTPVTGRAPDPRVARWLAELGEQLTPHLFALAASRDPALRARAVALLAELGVPFADARLRAAVRDEALRDELAAALSAPACARAREHLRAWVAAAAATEKTPAQALVERLPLP